jgi:hypothetical protein
VVELTTTRRVSELFETPGYGSRNFRSEPSPVSDFTSSFTIDAEGDYPLLRRLVFLYNGVTIRQADPFYTGLL